MTDHVDDAKAAKHVQHLSQQGQSLAKAAYEECLGHSSAVSPAESCHRLRNILQALQVLRPWHGDHEDLSVFSPSELQNILVLWALSDLQPASTNSTEPAYVHSCLRRRDVACDSLSMFQEQLQLLQVPPQSMLHTVLANNAVAHQMILRFAFVA